MKIIEVICTKNEEYTVFEDGSIARKKGHFKPTEPRPRKVFSIPPKPAPSDYDMVAVNRWGHEVARKNGAIWHWERDCQSVQEKIECAHIKQEQALKRKISSLRKRYNQQQALKNKDICFLERIGNYMFGVERE